MTGAPINLRYRLGEECGERADRVGLDMLSGMPAEYLGGEF